jgi:glucosamine-6-phosphate deaminase
VRLRVFRSADLLARRLALEIARALELNPSLVLGLPTGRTPVPLYRELVRLHDAGDADFSRASTFNLDEFVGLPPSDARGYRAFMDRHLFGGVNLSRRRINFLNGAAPDLMQECVRYERAISRAGGIDVQILGLGGNGHIGFNEPGISLVARSHRTALTTQTRRANVALFGHRLADVPREALSMGMATILGSRRIMLVATGAAKARCVQRAIEGPVTPRLPGSFLQLHPHVEIWLDRGAAGRLGSADSQ